MTSGRQNRTGIVGLSIAAFAILAVLGAAPGHPSDTALSSPSLVKVSSPLAPPPADFDPSLVGSKAQVRNIVESPANGYLFPQDGQVAGAASNQTCILQHTTPIGSGGNTNDKRIHLVGVITNRGGCIMQPGYTSLGQNEVIAIFARLNIPPATAGAKYGSSLGDVWVVKYDRAAGGQDAWVGNAPSSAATKPHWTMGKCGHGMNSQTDGMFLFVGTGDQYGAGKGCQQPPMQAGRFTTMSITAFLAQPATRALILKAFDANAGAEIAFWWVCGPDCCYADLSS
jgi:hypothetical protein